MVASDGGIFSFGDAAFYGSMGGTPLNQPIVGIASDAATGGYWEVASDGGIFSYNAPFFGSTGSIKLNKPIVGMEASPSGQGYRFVASDGGHLHLRAGALRRLDGRHAAGGAGRGHGPGQRHERLLDGGRRRRHLHLRRAPPTSAGWSARPARYPPAAGRSDEKSPAFRFTPSVSWPIGERGPRGEDIVRHRAHRRVAPLLLPVGIMMIGSIAAGLTAAPAGAAGILPPANPPANIAPSSADWLTSIDAARAREGVGTDDLSRVAAGRPCPSPSRSSPWSTTSASTGACRRSTT